MLKCLGVFSVVLVMNQHFFVHMVEIVHVTEFVDVGVIETDFVGAEFASFHWPGTS
jgi:hypothetical protein